MRRSIRHIKFYKYYKQWVDTYKVGDTRKVTLNKYYLIARELKKMAPDLDLGSMTRMDVQRIVNEYGKTHELATVRDFMHHIGRPLHDAAYEGWVAKDPYYEIQATSQVPHKKTRKKFIENVDQINRLIKVFDKHHSAVSRMFDFDLRTGLRFAELLGVTPSELNFQKMTLYVNQTLNYKDRPIHIDKRMKNKYSHRVISIDWKAMQDIQPYLQDCGPDEPVWVKAIAKEHKPRYRAKSERHYKNMQIYNSTFNKILTKYCEEANVPRISIHGLRHTHASLLILNHVSVESVAKRLGHGNTETTERVYIHQLDKLRQEDNNKIMTALTSLGA